MFGLEDKKNKDESNAQFDLEMELKSSRKRRETVVRIEERIAQLKAALRSGQEQNEYDDVGILLQGYAALLKVVERFGEKRK